MEDNEIKVLEKKDYLRYLSNRLKEKLEKIDEKENKNS